MNDNELMHYGVLGMKWGVRRYQNKDGTLTNAGKKRYKTDSSTQVKMDSEHKTLRERVAESRRKKALTATDPAKVAKYSKYLSDDELQARIRRVEQEKRLTDMYTSQMNTNYFNGKKATGQAFMKAAEGIGLGLSDIAKGATFYLGKKFIGKTFGDDVVKEMFPKKDNKNDEKKKEDG